MDFVFLVAGLLPALTWALICWAYLATLSKRQDETARLIRGEALAKYHNVALGWSGGSDSRVLLDLVLPFKRDLPTVFVDTQHEFKQSYKYVDDVRRELHLTKHTTVMADKDREKEFAK